jgi:hypothetical protein
MGAVQEVIESKLSTSPWSKDYLRKPKDRFLEQELYGKLVVSCLAGS